jgi:hypothetical protein
VTPRGRALIATAVLLAGNAGCHTMRFDVAKAPGLPVVTERQSFYLWGLTPTVRIDMRARCPHGVAQLTEETTFLNGVFEFLTLGIWSPRTMYYSCRSAPLEG